MDLTLIDFICVHVCFILSNAGFSACTVHICTKGWPESKGLNVQSTCIVTLVNDCAPIVYFFVFICMYKRIGWINRLRYSKHIVIFENDCAAILYCNAWEWFDCTAKMYFIVFYVAQLIPWICHDNTQEMKIRSLQNLISLKRYKI